MELTQSQIDQFLKSERIGFLATARPNGQPHVVPIWFDWYNEKITFISDSLSIKGKNLQKNTHATLAVGGKRTVIIEGETSGKPISEWSGGTKDSYAAKYGPTWDSPVTETWWAYELIPSRIISWEAEDDM